MQRGSRDVSVTLPDHNRRCLIAHQKQELNKKFCRCLLFSSSPSLGIYLWLVFQMQLSVVLYLDVCVLIWLFVFPLAFSLIAIRFIVCAVYLISSPSCFLVILVILQLPRLLSYPLCLDVILCFAPTLSFPPRSASPMHKDREPQGSEGEAPRNPPLHLGSFSFGTGNRRRGKLTYGGREQPPGTLMSPSEDAVTCNPFFIYSYLLFFSSSFILSGLSFVYFRGFLSLLFLSTLGLAFFCMFVFNILLVVNLNEKEVSDN